MSSLTKPVINSSSLALEAGTNSEVSKKGSSDIESSLDKSYYQIIPNTTRTYASFYTKRAFFKKGTKQEIAIINPLSKEDQFKLIRSIFESYLSVRTEDGVKFAFNKNSVSNYIGFIDRVKTSFMNSIQAHFKEIYHYDKESRELFLCVPIEEIFEELKVRPTYSYSIAQSVFIKEYKLVIDNYNKGIVFETPITYDPEILKDISKTEYDLIVNGMLDHWQGYIPLILDHMVAGVYASNKKSLWFVIMARSNFGKSKIFDFMRKYEYVARVRADDFIADGISDIKVSDIQGKMALVIDEMKNNFSRKLYEVSDHVMIRPMREHSVKVDLNSKYMLTASGGFMNDSFMEEQAMNRICAIDLTEERVALGDRDFVKQTSEKRVEVVMGDYLTNELIKRVNEYESLTELKRADKADDFIRSVLAKYKVNKSTLYEALDVALQMLTHDISFLNDRMKEELLGRIRTHYVRGELRGWLITTNDNLLIDYFKSFDHAFAFELKFESVKKIFNELEPLGYKYKSSFKVRRYEDDEPINTRGMYIPNRHACVDFGEVIELDYEQELVLKLNNNKDAKSSYMVNDDFDSPNY